MGQKRVRFRPPDQRIVGEDEGLLEGSLPQPSFSESQLWRVRLRGRWELACVLNFLRVFRPFVKGDLKLSAEDLEIALITPNDDLARLHITLLKGIFPVSKIRAGSEAWVTVLCDKISMWWPWVAGGDVPLFADHGAEIERYKELDPTMRLVILKALCEIRLQQDDMSRYVSDKVKNGNEISAFRTDRISGDENGTSYWFDGDWVIGHRLYREDLKGDLEEKLTGKGRTAQTIANPHWELLATNIEEFQEISDKLSCSNNMAEFAVGNVVKFDLIPLLEKAHEKRKRTLQRKLRESKLLRCNFSSKSSGNVRLCRDRRPVNYTFDEYDRCIDEALQTAEKSKIEALGDDGSQPEESVHSEDDAPVSSGALVNAGTLECRRDSNCVKSTRTGGGSDDDEDGNYDENDDGSEDDDVSKDDDGAHNEDMHEPDKEKGNRSRQTRYGPTPKQDYVKIGGIAGLRRSRRNIGRGPWQIELSATETMKKRLGKRSTLKPDIAVQIISDSEDGEKSE